MLTRLAINFLILLGYIPDWLVRKVKSVHNYLGWFGIIFMICITPILFAVRPLWISFACWVFAIFLCRGEQEKRLTEKSVHARKSEARYALGLLADHIRLYHYPDRQIKDYIDPAITEYLRKIDAGLN